MRSSCRSTSSGPLVRRTAAWLSCLGLACCALGYAYDIDTDGAPAARRVVRCEIAGIIDLGLAPFVARAAASAEETGAAALLLDIDTFGGRVDAAVKIRDALLDAGVPTIAYIHPRAISAGALISLACQTIIMTPGGSMGAATPVTGGAGGEMKTASEKVISYMAAEMRATAERYDRDPEVAAAMVDPAIEIDGVIDEDKLLTLTTAEALALQFVDDEAPDLNEALAVAGFPGATIQTLGINWAERLARAVSHPVFSSMLLSLGFLGIMLELYQPGWGIPGTLGILALLLFFFGHTVVQLAGFEEVLLFGIGVVLVALEVFVIPGFGIVGFAGLAAMIGAAVMAMSGIDWNVAWELGYARQAARSVAVALGVVVLGGALLIRLVPRSRAAGRLVLDEGLGADRGFVAHATPTALPIGSVGQALTDLHPTGIAKVAGKRVDAISEGGFIARGAPLTLVGWRGGSALVRTAPEDPPSV